MKRLRDFESIAALLSEREIDELQAAIDARRASRAGSSLPTRAGRRPTQADPAGRATRKGGRAS